MKLTEKDAVSLGVFCLFVKEAVYFRFFINAVDKSKNEEEHLYFVKEVVLFVEKSGDLWQVCIVINSVFRKFDTKPQ